VSDAVEKVIFEVADALRVPVLVLALAALAMVLFEAGSFAVELVRRRRRNFALLERSVKGSLEALSEGDRQKAYVTLSPLARSAAMAETLDFIAANALSEGDTDRIAKALADFDFRALRRLERTRLLVRAGPALGLMGTLIPLSPALAGLAKGDVAALSENLRVAFSVTVLGLLVGAAAFGVSLVRDRLYGQDLSDLEYVASSLTAEGLAPVALAVEAATVEAAAAESPATEEPTAEAKAAETPTPEKPPPEGSS
jgi:biopolymer transport protein ExbB/TolQ